MENKERKSSLPIVAAVLISLYILIDIKSFFVPIDKLNIWACVFLAATVALAVVLFIRKKGIALIIPASVIFICDFISRMNGISFTIKAMMENGNEDLTYYIGMFIAIIIAIISILHKLIIVAMSVLDFVHIRNKAICVLANVLMIISVSCDVFIIMITLVPAIVSGRTDYIMDIVIDIVQTLIFNVGLVLVCRWLTAYPAVTESVTEERAEDIIEESAEENAALDSAEQV